MDALIGKLTNLGYEFFGVLFPGALASVMWLLVWLAAGDVVPQATNGTVPHLTIEIVMDVVQEAADWSVLVSFVLMIMVAYFVGHLLTWVARRGKSYKTVGIKIHLWDTLRFRPPKQDPSYDSKFEPMWQWAGRQLVADDVECTWPVFYATAKTYLLQQGTRSLVNTYQNKYTLHRSLAVAAAIATWGTAITAIFGIVFTWIVPEGRYAPHWLATGGIGVMSLVSVWGFSSSYLYNWALWGNYLITETYVCLRMKKAL